MPKARARVDGGPRGWPDLFVTRKIKAKSERLCQELPLACLQQHDIGAAPARAFVSQAAYGQTSVTLGRLTNR